MIAALFVETGGVYYGLDDVDPWDIERDAMLYAGPHPVVAHPPCSAWSMLANVNHARWGTPKGLDGDEGTFAHALACVRTFGGVLEQPAYSAAWSTFHLPAATRGAWSGAFDDPGVATEVSQSAYGHPARKRTWLYAVGCDVSSVSIDWSDPAGDGVVGAGINSGECVGRRRLTSSEALATPIPFRDLLLDIARSARVEAAA